MRAVPFVFAALASAVAAASPALIMSTSGRLLDGSDQPVAGPVALAFELHTASAPDSNDQVVWHDAYSSVQLDKAGTYAVVLGETTPPAGTGHTPLTPDELSGDRWLAISVNGTPLTPWLRVGMVPAAAHAIDADTVGGLSLADLDARYAPAAGAAGYVQLDTQASTTAQPGGFTVSGTITAGAFAGDGSGITNANAATLGGQTLADLDGRYAPLAGAAGYAQLSPAAPQTGTLAVTGKVTAGGFAGDGSALTNTPAVTLGGQSLSDLDGRYAQLSPSSPQAGSLSMSGNVTAARFIGDGSQLTGIASATNFGGLLAGDVTGPQGTTLVAGLRGHPIAGTTPDVRQVLAWNGSAWAPSNHNVTVTLSDATSIAVDATLGNVFDLTLGGNHVLANPHGLVDGDTYLFRIRQDATGGRSLGWGTEYLFAGVTSQIATTPNALSVIAFTSDGTNLYAMANYGAATSNGSLGGSTGGSITTAGNYRIHTFRSSGTFTAAANGTVEVLVVAGGGSGGMYTTTNANGGGGGGGVVYKSAYAVKAGPVTVTVGAGGPGVAGNSVGLNGQDSSFGSLVAFGGGGGGGSCAGPGQPGGSGGGGAYVQCGLVTAPYGYATQNVLGQDGYGHHGGGGMYDYTGGGGGGAGSPGLDGTWIPSNDNRYDTTGNGGQGVASDISGSLQYDGGGGGGGGNSDQRAGDGFDGGGRGCGTTSYYNYNAYPTGVNGTTHGSSTPDAIPNTGGGGGAGSYWSPNGGWPARSGNGGSGIVIVRYVP